MGGQEAKISLLDLITVFFICIELWGYLWPETCCLAWRSCTRTFCPSWALLVLSLLFLSTNIQWSLMCCWCHLQDILFCGFKMHPSFKSAPLGLRKPVLVPLLSHHPGLWKPACWLVSENSFLVLSNKCDYGYTGEWKHEKHVALKVKFSWFLILGQQQPLSLTPVTSCVSAKA